MHFASHSRNLRIGTGVSLAAFYDPIRLAEEVALLDNLTGGRVNWGAGSGFDPTELRVFGVDPEEKHARFRENVEIVLAAWGLGPVELQWGIQNLRRRGGVTETAAGSNPGVDGGIIARGL